MVVVEGGHDGIGIFISTGRMLYCRLRMNASQLTRLMPGREMNSQVRCSVQGKQS